MTGSLFALVGALLALTPPREHVLTEALWARLSGGLSQAAVGQWVTYRLSGRGGRSGFWRLAVVDTETDAQGRRAWWLELEFGAQESLVSPLAQVKLRVTQGSPGAAGAVTRMVIAVGAGRPRELSADLDPGSQSGTAPSPARSPLAASLQWRRGEQRRVMTAKGTLAVLPLELVYRQTVVQRVWLSREVPLLQLVLLEIPGLEHRLEVRDYGVDATSRMAMPDPRAPKLRWGLEGSTELLPPPFGAMHENATFTHP